MKYYHILLLLFINCVYCLPVVEVKEEEYKVQVDRLAQLIATHIQFDHLDTVIFNTDSFIATEFQHHLEINVLVNNDNQQQQQPFTAATLDMMDLEILKSQIFAAIHAHTEGSLPLVWDIDKLSKQAIESFIRQMLISTCGNSTTTADTITSSCLKDNAISLSDQLDAYIQQSLNYVFDLLDKETLPNLLKHTAADLKGILHYFNSVFLQDSNRSFVLEVIPWKSDDPNDIHNFKSKLLELSVRSNDKLEKLHSSAFFIEYASMAKV